MQREEILDKRHERCFFFSGVPIDMSGLGLILTGIQVARAPKQLVRGAIKRDSCRETNFGGGADHQAHQGLSVVFAQNLLEFIHISERLHSCLRVVIPGGL